MRRSPTSGRVGGDVGAHRDRPEGELVPGQQVAREGQGEGEQEQHDAHDPVELPRGFVRAGPEDPAHVQEDDDDHGVGRPAVHVAQDDAEGHDELEVLHAAVGFRRVGHVVEHQREAGHGQHREEDGGDEAQAQGVARTKAVPAHPRRVDVQEEARDHHRRAILVRPRPADAEDRPAGRRQPRARARSGSRPTSGLEPEVRPHPAVEVHDHLAAGGQAERVPGQGRGRRAVDDPAVLVEAAAVARALEARSALPHVAAEMRAHGGDRRRSPPRR